jgi:hypothetical protein
MVEVDGAGSDAVLSALAGRRRRDILHRLLMTEAGTRTFEELVTYLLERDAESRSQSRCRSEPPDRETVAGRLHHVHLPILSEIDLVEYESVHGLVWATDQAEAYEPVLRAVRRAERADRSASGLGRESERERSNGSGSERGSRLN